MTGLVILNGLQYVHMGLPKLNNELQYNVCTPKYFT